MKVIPLERITYRAPLALSFVDGVTGEAVREGLHVQAWRTSSSGAGPVRRLQEARPSPQSALYGFPTLPGLEGYTRGDEVPAGALSYVIEVEDRRERYLPQTRRFDLPLPDPAVQRIRLLPDPAYPTPAGFAPVRGLLLRTTAPTGVPPQVTALEPAAWARVTATAPAPIATDPPVTYEGFADARGSFVLFVAHPPIPADTLLADVTWTITLAVEHDPVAIAADVEEIRQARPALAEPAPTHATLTGGPAARLFDTVSLVNAEERIYEVVSAVDETSVERTLRFQQPLIVRTEVAGSPEHPLSEFLIRS
ncbi:MAG: hypothetical protein R3272_15475 [Candidatus Promineifilaceae bacterium]|nr:hypothetical protein [Candidatus Promineifilaceae bacterium]